jgi:hypothetical protein
LICIAGTTHGQIPVEVFAGHEKTTLDIMFFRFFKTDDGKDSCWLFFNRNRAGVDYHMTDTTFLPHFGFTEVVSYTHEDLLGFAPVVVGQVLSGGVYSKPVFTPLVSLGASSSSLGWSATIEGTSCGFLPALALHAHDHRHYELVCSG